MIVVYEKGTNKLIGMAPQVFDNGVMREFTMEELYRNLDPKTHGCFFIEDSDDPLLHPDHWQFKLDKKGIPIGIEKKIRPSIQLSTDATDSDGDGMPELKADGKSTATINIQLMEGAKPLKKAMDVKVSTTGGRLSKRVVTTAKTTGKAKVELTSVEETITIKVTASGLVDDLEEGSITFELMP